MPLWQKNHARSGSASSLLLAASALVALPGCRTLQELANLRDVRFAIDRVAGAELAGVDLTRVRSYEDLTPTDVLRLGRAASSRSLPLAFTLHLEAENPPSNSVAARMVQMDWTLLLEDRETVSGTFNEDVTLPPGEPTDVPISIRLDLVEFFGENLRDLVELALAVSGEGGRPKEVKLEAIPTIETPLGPVRYPQPITIVTRELGGAAEG